MSKWELLHSCIEKTHFFSTFLHNPGELSSFFIQKPEDTCSDICRGCGGSGIIWHDTCDIRDCSWTNRGWVGWRRVQVWDLCTNLFVWAHVGDVTLLWAFKASSFLSVFLLLCLSCSFSYCRTCSHGIWISWGKLSTRRMCVPSIVSLLEELSTLVAIPLWHGLISLVLIWHVLFFLGLCS